MQKVVTSTLNGMLIPCSGKSLSGTWVAHITYHLGKDGKIDRVHLNTLHQDLWDTDTGEKAMYIDALNDNLGINFDLLNSLNASYGSHISFDVPDGWLDEYMPETLPVEGTYVEMNWKFKISGEFYGYSNLMRLNKNANGDVTVDFTTSRVDCL